MADDERPRLRAELDKLTTKVPPAVNNGSYNLSVDFKKKVVAARKVAAKLNPSEAELRGAIGSLQPFWA